MWNIYSGDFSAWNRWNWRFIGRTLLPEKGDEIIWKIEILRE